MIMIGIQYAIPNFAGHGYVAIPDPSLVIVNEKKDVQFRII